MKKINEQTYTIKEVQKNLDQYLSSSADRLRNSISKYSDFSLRKVSNLAGSLRKSSGMRILKKIKVSRKNDW